MKYFKNGKYGWFAGSRFRVVSRRKWNGKMVYALKYDFSKLLDYNSHTFLVREKCFQYNKKGDYIGRVEP